MTDETDETIEVVAQAIYASDHSGACDHKVWENMRQVDCELYRKNAAAAITTYQTVLKEGGKQIISEHDLQELMTNRNVYEG